MKIAAAPNRFCVLPMEGADAGADGAPGPLTVRRYTRYARGGFGLIWMEATAVSAQGRSRPGQLRLHAGNVDVFADLVRTVRAAAQERFDHDLLIVLQLAHAAGECTDAYLDTLVDTTVDAARLARQAGFDGVDVKSCHDALGAALLADTRRPGPYGGALENRSRFLRAALTRIRSAIPDLLLATRLSIHHPTYHPCGIEAREAPALVRSLVETGLGMLCVSAADSYTDPRFSSASKSDPRPGLDHAIAVTRELQQAFPDLAVVGPGLTRLGEQLPSVAADLLKSGSLSFAAVGRGALAYPDLPADIAEHGTLDPARCCILCGACSRLVRDGGHTGCVIFDAETYGPAYRRQRRFALDHLTAEARRCHQCDHAPCAAACPNHIDVPAFIKAFAEDDSAGSYHILRRANVLPEMCSHLCPTWMLCEGACVENALSGNPIPIADLQYTVSWLAREARQAGIVFPGTASGREVAIVGAGPTGIACAVKLLERGHRVVVYDQNDAPGGTPHYLIPTRRLPDTRPELDAILAPALAANRLELRLGQALGRDVTLADLQNTHNAVLVATGLWTEATLGTAEGVVSGIDFLRETKNGTRTAVPDTVAVLAGDDCAMDAAVTAKALGAAHVYIIHPGPRSTLHWHKAEDWFKTEGVHCLVLTQPLGYETDADGRLTGLRIARTCPPSPCVAGTEDSPTMTVIPHTESVLQVQLVIEAMSLHSATPACPENVFTAGGMINGGATVAQCIADGMQVANAIHTRITEVMRFGARS